MDAQEVDTSSNAPSGRPLARLARDLMENPHEIHQRIKGFIAENDFPLVSGSTATFFFYDGDPVDELYLLHWVFGLESRIPFKPFGRTNAWYATVELPRSGRVEYKLELHRSGHRRWLRDPHNDRLALDPFGANSVCPMPDYHEPFWAFPEPGVRPGELERFTLRSEAWGEDREVVVYLPNEYKPHKTYPLLICQDGNDYLKYASIKTVLDNLIHRKEVLPLVVAFISGSAQRNVEYGANPKQVAHIVDEVLPAMEKRYGVSSEPRYRGLMGASFGGVSTLFTAWSRPGVFGRLLLQSGSFVFTDVGHHGRNELWDPVVGFVNDFRADPARIEARVFMSCGHFESLIAYNRHIAPLLDGAGIPVRFVEAPDGHNWVAWRDRLREGLTWLFSGHLWMTYE